MAKKDTKELNQDKTKNQDAVDREIRAKKEKLDKGRISLNPEASIKRDATLEREGRIYNDILFDIEDLLERKEEPITKKIGALISNGILSKKQVIELYNNQTGKIENIEESLKVLNSIFNATIKAVYIDKGIVIDPSNGQINRRDTERLQATRRGIEIIKPDEQFVNDIKLIMGKDFNEDLKQNNNIVNFNIDPLEFDEIMKSYNNSFKDLGFMIDENDFDKEVMNKDRRAKMLSFGLDMLNKKYKGDTDTRDRILAYVEGDYEKSGQLSKEEKKDADAIITEIYMDRLTDMKDLTVDEMVEIFKKNPDTEKALKLTLLVVLKNKDLSQYENTDTIKEIKKKAQDLIIKYAKVMEKNDPKFAESMKGLDFNEENILKNLFYNVNELAETHKSIIKAYHLTKWKDRKKEEVEKALDDIKTEDLVLEKNKKWFKDSKTDFNEDEYKKLKDFYTDVTINSWIEKEDDLKVLQYLSFMETSKSIYYDNIIKSEFDVTEDDSKTIIIGNDKKNKKECLNKLEEYKNNKMLSRVAKDLTDILDTNESFIGDFSNPVDSEKKERFIQDITFAFANPNSTDELKKIALRNLEILSDRRDEEGNLIEDFNLLKTNKKGELEVNFVKLLKLYEKMSLNRTIINEAHEKVLTSRKFKKVDKEDIYKYMKESEALKLLEIYSNNDKGAYARKNLGSLVFDFKTKIPISKKEIEKEIREEFAEEIHNLENNPKMNIEEREKEVERFIKSKQLEKISINKYNANQELLQSREKIENMYLKYRGREKKSDTSKENTHNEIKRNNSNTPKETIDDKDKKLLDLLEKKIKEKKSELRQQFLEDPKCKNMSKKEFEKYFKENLTDEIKNLENAKVAKYRKINKEHIKDKENYLKSLDEYMIKKIEVGQVDYAKDGIKEKGLERILIGIKKLKEKNIVPKQALKDTLSLAYERSRLTKLAEGKRRAYDKDYQARAKKTTREIRIQGQKSNKRIRIMEKNIAKGLTIKNAKGEILYKGKVDGGIVKLGENGFTDEEILRLVEKHNEKIEIDNLGKRKLKIANKSPKTLKKVVKYREKKISQEKAKVYFESQVNSIENTEKNVGDVSDLGDKKVNLEAQEIAQQEPQTEMQSETQTKKEVKSQLHGVQTENIETNQIDIKDKEADSKNLSTSEESPTISNDTQQEKESQENGLVEYKEKKGLAKVFEWIKEKIASVFVKNDDINLEIENGDNNSNVDSNSIKKDIDSHKGDLDNIRVPNEIVESTTKVGIEAGIAQEQQNNQAREGRVEESSDGEREEL